MNKVRLPLRLARREVRRRPGRTVLVALLVAIPVAGMVLATVTIHTGDHTLAEEWERRNGQADAVAYRDPAMPDLVSGLPAGSRVVDVSSTYFRARTADGLRGDIELSDLPIQDPIAVGIHELVEGRAATKPGEVALSRQTADRFDVGVGDELVLDRPELTFTVVGLVEPVGCLGCSYALVAPGEVPSEAAERYGQGTFALVDLPTLTPEQTTALVDAGLEMRVDAIAGFYGSGEDRSVQWSLVIGAIVLTVVGIVISAAFAVGARRQLVTLGQLSASGASPATVRAALVLQGTVTGVLGSVLGLAIATTVLLTGRGMFEGFMDERIHTYDVSVSDVLLAVVIGVVAATVSALIPARTAARIPTLAALAGRRPLSPVSRRLVVGGFLAMAGGLGLLGLAVVGSRSGGNGDLWAFVAIIGGIGELLGACAIAPAVVARLEPLAHRMRGAPRLGARSLARNRARTGAVVSAVAAAGALAVAAGALVLGGLARQDDELTMPDGVVVFSLQGYDEKTGDVAVSELPDAEVLDQARDALPGAVETTLRATEARRGGAGDGYWVTSVDPTAIDPRLTGDEGVFSGTYDRALIADDDLLDAIDAGADVRQALDDTGLVTLTAFGNADIVASAPGLADPIPGRAVHTEHDAGYISDLLISEATATRLGFDIVPSAVLFDSPEGLTESQRDRLEDLQYDYGFSLAGRNATLSVFWQYQDNGPTPLQIELILSGIALVFSLFVVGVSLALAAAESKDERDILTIAGAPPGALARSAGARAWLLAAIGGAMAIPVGFLPVIVFSYASHDSFVDERFPLVFPTRTVLLLVLAVPAIVSAVSFASSATAQRLRPVRVSTATFE